MKKKIMICGVDCHPGDVNCNNYCNHDTKKPMADRAPDATPEQQLMAAKWEAIEKLSAARDAWYEYFCDLVELNGQSDASSNAHKVFVILRSAMGDA